MELIIEIALGILLGWFLIHHFFETIFCLALLVAVAYGLDKAIKDPSLFLVPLALFAGVWTCWWITKWQDELLETIKLVASAIRHPIRFASSVSRAVWRQI